MRKLLNGFVIAFVGDFGPHRSPTDYKRWIENAGGQIVNARRDSYTHLVVSEDAWDDPDDIVCDAIEGDKPIVKQGWIDEALATQKKPAMKRIPTQFNWRNGLRAKTTKKKEPKTKTPQTKEPKTKEPKKNKAATDDVPKKRSRSKYVNALEDETARFASRESKKPKLSHEKVFTDSRPSEAFVKSTKAAKKHLLSKDHHHYTDETGFEYNIMLVRVLKALNQNQQLHMQIFESNLDPKTYAVITNTRSLRTGKEEQKNLASVGVPFHTALRSFKVEFEAKTGVKWEDRARKFKCAEPKETGSARRSTFITQEDVYNVGGARHNAGSKQLSEEDWSKFEKQLWMWRRPAQGEPQGTEAPILTPPSTRASSACPLAGSHDQRGELDLAESSGPIGSSNRASLPVDMPENPGSTNVMTSFTATQEEISLLAANSDSEWEDTDSDEPDSMPESTGTLEASHDASETDMETTMAEEKPEVTPQADLVLKEPQKAQQQHEKRKDSFAPEILMDDKGPQDTSVTVEARSETKVLEEAAVKDTLVAMTDVQLQDPFKDTTEAGVLANDTDLAGEIAEANEGLGLDEILDHIDGEGAVAGQEDAAMEDDAMKKEGIAAEGDVTMKEAPVLKKDGTVEENNAKKGDAVLNGNAAMESAASGEDAAMKEDSIVGKDAIVEGYAAMKGNAAMQKDGAVDGKLTMEKNNAVQEDAAMKADTDVEKDVTTEEETSGPLEAAKP